MTLVLACLSVPQAHGEVIERLLATVSGQLIMASDVTALRRLGLVSSTDTDRAVVEQLINRALILAEVDRYAPPEPPEAAIASRLERVRARFTDPAAFVTTLAELGLDEGAIRGRIRQDLRIDAYLDQRFVVVPPTDDEVLAAYQANPERFNTPEARTLDAVRSDVVRAIVEQRREPRIMEWIAGLRRRSRIVILVDGSGAAAVSE